PKLHFFFIDFPGIFLYNREKGFHEGRRVQKWSQFKILLINSGFPRVPYPRLSTELRTSAKLYKNKFWRQPWRWATPNCAVRRELPENSVFWPRLTTSSIHSPIILPMTLS